MKRAIEEYTITGIQTTLPFGTFVMNHPKFISGDFNTHFIQENFDPEMLKVSNNANFEVMASAAVAFFKGSSAELVEADSPANSETTSWYQQRRQLRNG
jgi:acetyl/propionyl-CoA carboxylase alpha subunit